MHGTLLLEQIGDHRSATLGQRQLAHGRDLTGLNRQDHVRVDHVFRFDVGRLERLAMEAFVLEHAALRGRGHERSQACVVYVNLVEGDRLLLEVHLAGEEVQPEAGQTLEFALHFQQLISLEKTCHVRCSLQQ